MEVNIVNLRSKITYGLESARTPAQHESITILIMEYNKKRREYELLR